MKRVYSLKGRNLFKKVFHKGKRIQDKGIQIFFLKFDKVNDIKPVQFNNSSTDNKNIKIGISLGRKFGNAITRNRERRRIKAICSELLHDMLDGFYIIIRVKKRFRVLRFQEEKSIIRSLFVRAGVIIK